MSGESVKDGGKGSGRRTRQVNRTTFSDNWDAIWNKEPKMTAQDWIDHCFNVGYNDGLKGDYHLNFNKQMREGAMGEDYERGYTDGRIDASRPRRT